LASRDLRRFDMVTLHAALDHERRARALSWADVTAEINKPFKHTTSIPISVSTLRGLTSKRSVTSAVVLQVLRWLGCSPEDFLAGRLGQSSDNEKLLRAAPNQIPRFDTRAMYEALDVERRRRGISWREVASELPGFTPNMLANLRSGPLIGFPRVMFLTQWLNCPASRFVRCCAR